MNYRISYESFIVVEADTEDEALVKAGEQPMDCWQDTDIECCEDE